MYRPYNNYDEDFDEYWANNIIGLVESFNVFGNRRRH